MVLITALATVALVAVYQAGTLSRPAPLATAARTSPPDPVPPKAVATETNPTPRTAPGPRPEPKAEPRPEPKLEPKAEPRPEPKPKLEPKAEFRPEPARAKPTTVVAEAAKTEAAPKEPPPPRKPPESLSKLPPFRPPYTVEEIRATLRAIESAPDSGGDANAREEAAALRRLKAYRYLCGIPYADLSIDPHMTELATAAAEVCEALGHMTHTPTENPGLSDERFAQGREGAGKSNLGDGYPKLVESVDGWMEDSDDRNIDRVGHRR